MDNEYIHIAFCVDDIYARYIAVSIKSIAENFRMYKGGGICIHVVTDNISKKSVDRLDEIINGYERLSLRIHRVNDSILKGLKTNSWTIYAWYRLLLPNILPIDIKRVLYLDADTLVMSDLSELFTIDMTDKSIAGVIEDNTFNKEYYDRLGYKSDKQYICSGVLLMNLEYWREHHLAEKMINWAIINEDKLKLPDQDTINYICQDTKIILPLRFNIIQFFFTNEQFYKQPYLTQLKDCIENPAIIHYAFYGPWYKDAPRHIMYDYWIKYNRMLLHPVKLKYKSKGRLKLKHIIWDMLHNINDRQNISLKDIKCRLANL